MSLTALVVVIVVVALVFDYTNGFHDSANAIATTISTKALTPRAALAMAAVGNVLGATALGYYVLAYNLSGWPVGMFSQPVRSVAPAGSRR